MIKWLSLSEEQRKISLQQAAIKTGLREDAIEKDWWVTLTLKALFTCKYRDALVFKGGTSLSKCWSLISRFSEDIDIALDSRVFGIHFENPSRQELKKLRKGGCNFTRTYLKQAIESALMELNVPEGMATLHAVEQQPGSTDDDPQVLNLVYPSLFPPPEYLLPDVKIEVSVRSMREPVLEAETRSLLSGVTDITVLEEKSFKLQAVHPKRTFLEKLFLLHEEFQKPTQAAEKAFRKSRHLYDIHALNESPYKREALEDEDLYNSIVLHRQLYTKLGDINYSHHGKEAISFIPPAPVMTAYNEDYQIMKEQMIYGNPPEFNKLISKLLDLLVEIRNQRKSQIPIEKFKQLSGSYVRWWKDNKSEAQGRIFARAQIQHVEASILSIKVSTLLQYGNDDNHGKPFTEGKHEEWSGEVIMDNEHSGTIKWQQVLPPNGSSGIKRISIHQLHGGISIVGEKDFGVENFTDKE